MECRVVREAVSARLDGEDLAIGADERARVDAHLQTCDSCAAWAEHAAVLRRRTAMTAAATPPDLAPRILAEVMPGRVTRRVRRARRERVLRLVLAATGLLLAAGVAVVAALGPEVVAPAEHLTSTTGFWAGVVGLGFLVVAVRPRYAFRLAPVLAMAAAFLVIASIYDLVGRHIHPVHEVPTAVTLVGIAALALLIWPNRYVGVPAATRPTRPEPETSVTTRRPAQHRRPASPAAPGRPRR